MSFSDLKISAKLGLAFCALILTSAIASSIVFVSLQRIDEATVASERSLALAATAEEALTLILEQQNALRGYVLMGDKKFAKTYEESSAKFDQTLDGFATKTTIPEQKARIQRLREAMATWRHDIGAPVMSLMNDPAAGRDQAIQLTGKKSLTALRAIQKELLTAANERVAIRTAEAKAAMTTAVLSLLIGGGVALVIAGLMGWWLWNAIARPVAAMTGAMRRLASGDNSVAVPAQGRKDEIGDMAAAVAHFKDAAVEKIRVERAAAEHRAAADSERAANEAEKAAIARDDAIAVAALNEALDHLASGDLTHRITVPFAPKTESLRTNFNAAAERMQDAIQAIGAATDGVNSGSDEIAQASDNLSRRTEQQAASLEQTAAALDQITATVRKTASGAQEVSRVVAAARADAQRSGQIVGQAVSAMTEIETSSDQVSQIIGVIDEIAFQTNLLALNAGVEAARAGEAGRGFAVVAQEVRALAQRSANAAKEIKDLINVSGQQVSAGVERVGRTREALQRIIARVAEIDAQVNAIAASARDQAQGLGEVNTTMGEMDRVVQQNAAMVEETTAAAHALRSESQELADRVDLFEIGQAPTARQKRAA